MTERRAGKSRLVYDKQRRTIVPVRTDGWQPIDTCPKDGTHFLAWQVVKADELDEDDNVIRKDVIEESAVVAYHGPFPFHGIVTYPWRGSKPINVTYTHWMPLPARPDAHGEHAREEPT